MKKVITGLFVLLLGGGFMLAGLASGNILVTYPVAFVIILLYLLKCARNARRKSKQNQFDLAFRGFLRNQARHRYS